MKVAITHPYSWPEVRRGAERIVVETARALAARGHSVTLFTSGSSPGRESVDGYTMIRYRRRFGDGLRHERWFARAVLPRLATGRFDVVHSMFPRDAIAAVRARKLGRHRVVYEELGIPFEWWWQQLPDQAVRRQVLAKVDDYGCMSIAALRVLAHDHGREGVLIPGGVRLDDFRTAERRDERPTILFSGALTEPRKGLGLLLEALTIVARKEPDAQLWLSGPGDPSALLAQAPREAREHTVVLPLGEPREQGERYGRAWVTALPSRNDSFGMVLVESLACGTPIVVGDDGAPPELVTPQTGVVVGLDDPQQLAAGLIDGFRLAEHAETADRCRASARPFDWESGVAPVLETIYKGRAVSPLAGEPALGG